ncbi:MAG: glucose-6-phosphate isomerase [Bacilli bacterium]|nr:glucose-6-phosphate isomerase [Bacilli bacterium]
MREIHLNYEELFKFVSKEELEERSTAALLARTKLIEKTGLGNDYIGWFNNPFFKEEGVWDEILAVSKQIREQSQVLVVIGIGGSYLGAKAAIEMLGSYFHKPELEIVFAEHTLSSTYTKALLDYLADKDFSINVISKSGTTTEPALAFRLFYELLKEKYGRDANKRVYVTTDPEAGLLRQIAKKEKFKSFYIPSDIGGRYSVLTPVGLLPMACAGIPIKEVMRGAIQAHQDFLASSFWENDMLIYASIRHILFEKNKKIEIFVNYEPNMVYLSEWLKQLFGESEGKEGLGLFPASVLNSTDLHSMGQYIQEGPRILFETILKIKEPTVDFTVPKVRGADDKLQFLEEKTMDFINEQAFMGAMYAHIEGEVPNIVLEIEKVSPFHFGYLVMFFMISCGVSGYLLGVNPFNQEGVEAYKKKMFALLGKE